MSPSRNRPDPGEWTPRQAVQRYLQRRKADSTEGSLDGWKYRLKLFVEWCESVGIEAVGQLQPYDMDEYYDLRAGEVEPVTLEGEMWTLSSFAEFLENLDATEHDLADSVRVPDLDPSERSSDKKLHTDDALRLIEYYRNDEQAYGTRNHALLELAWFTGARQGGLRALDLRDVELEDEPYVTFRHRPGSDTPLKNKVGGERPVAIRSETAEVLRTYIDRYRYGVRDDHGRQPLLASTQGRPNSNTVRVWCYLATLPCQYGPCPHGKEPAACSWTNYSEASKCPSSRSPHQIRTGTVTWLLNRGWPPEDVSERVNASVKTIENHYDKADLDERRRRLRERMEKRRRPLLDQLDLDDDSNYDNKV